MTINDLIQLRNNAVGVLSGVQKALGQLISMFDGAIADLRGLDSAMDRLQQGLNNSVFSEQAPFDPFIVPLDELTNKLREALQHSPVMLTKLEHESTVLGGEMEQQKQAGVFTGLKFIEQLQELAKTTKQLTHDCDPLIGLAVTTQDLAVTLANVLLQLESSDEADAKVRAEARKLQPFLKTVRSAQARVQSTIFKLKKLLNTVSADIEAATTLTPKYQQQLDSLIPGLSSEVPVVLLPVRLETRFKGAELWVRIYPDDIHQDMHEPGLTEDEVVWGKHFWEQTWRAGANDSNRMDRLQAWNQLAGRFGPNRAAWIAHALLPENATDRPAVPVEALKPAPRFPTLPQPLRTTTRAPYTRVMPDRWLAIAYSLGNRILQWGELIPDPLDTALSPESNWKTDFDEAVRKGMGIRIPLKNPESGVDRLIVLGVKGTMKPDISAILLHSLLEAHHYTWGLGFAPVGTPTNNADAVRSGYNSRDSGFEGSFTSEIENILTQPGDGSDGDKAARALGISHLQSFVFGHVPHANARDQEAAKLMQAVLWPATWGYYIQQQLDDVAAGVLRHANLDTWESYYTEYVRARGPLPTLRIGDQPYGLLPVTSFRRFLPTNPGTTPFNAQSMLDWLRKLSENWTKALAGVPRFDYPDSMTNRVNPDQNLLTILGMNAISKSCSGRSAFGPKFTDTVWSVINQPLSSIWEDKLDEKTTPVWNHYHFPVKPFLSYLTFDARPFDLKCPLVQADPVSEVEELKDNYIAWLAKASPVDIHDQNYPGGSAPNTLLYFLLRHSILQAYANTALQLQSGTQHAYIQEPELIDFPSQFQDNVAKTPTSWRYLHDGVAINGQKRDQYLYDRINVDIPPMHKSVVPLREFINQLKALSKLPTASLERLLMESLDLCSYRLDAWITSCATYRLQAMQNMPKGIHIGGYGWVENLRPRSRAAAENAGFVHAPSLAQATTAAVLRSGYLSHKMDQQHEALALDLSSGRVRLAKWLLEGVRNGQPLGALLGYRFERGLHENHPDSKQLDKYIAPFRELAPLVAGKQIPIAKDQTFESIAPNNVVDGLALHNRWKNGKKTGRWDETTIPFGEPAFPPNRITDRSKLTSQQQQAQKEYDAVEAELIALEDAIDAISDTLVAESVHQAIQGNPLRSGASLDAIARGETPPQDIEVLKTPRTGIGLTHRLVVLFSDAATEDSLTTKWISGAATPEAHKPMVRAAAEPHLNAWAARFLGDPAKVKCRVKYTYSDPETKETALVSRTITLKELNLCPLDLLYASPVSEQAQRSDLEQWLIYYAMQTRPGAVPADSGLQLVFARDERWTPDTLSVPEVLEIARAGRDLILGARALDARDVAQPGENTQPSVDLQDLQLRAKGAFDALNKAYEDLQNLLATGEQDVDLDVLRKSLLCFAYFGLPGAVPLSPAGNTNADRDILLNQSYALLKVVRALLESISQDDPQARLQEIFGRGFRILPRFTASADITRAFSRRIEAGDATPVQAISWLQRIARIRDGAARLNTLLLYAAASGVDEGLNFQVAQLPVSTDDQWVGLKLNGKKMPGGCLSLVAHTPGTFDATKQLPIAGLLIDEWVETVPNPTETTGLTFHYDAPGACAPQAILLAVPPEKNSGWNVETLETILLETLELAKLRTVDPDALAEHGDLGHFLPALFFAYNKGGDPNGDTIATNFKIT